MSPQQSRHGQATRSSGEFLSPGRRSGTKDGLSDGMLVIAEKEIQFPLLRERPHAVCFALWEPHVRAVFVAGDFNGWNPTDIPLERDGDGCWVTELLLRPGRHEYLFIVDGIWRPDPETECVPNPFGGVNSLVTVSTDGFC